MSPRRTVASAAPALSATVGWEATIAKCGGARSARSCVLYAARSSGLRRTSRTSARPHRRSPCRRSGGAGLCRRCGSGCGGAGCKGGGGVVAASRRDAYQSTRRARGRAADVARRRCGGRWQQPSLCVGLSVGARRMASRRGANLESQRWRRAGARGAAGKAGAAREGGGSEPEPPAYILSRCWRGGRTSLVAARRRKRADTLEDRDRDEPAALKKTSRMQDRDEPAAPKASGMQDRDEPAAPRASGVEDRDEPAALK